MWQHKITMRARHWLLCLAALFLLGCLPQAQMKITPNPAYAGDVVTFDGGASKASTQDANASITNYEWNFGDGTQATGKTATHTYKNAGEYQVVLKVTDNLNRTAEQRMTLKVLKKAIPLTDIKVVARGIDGAWLSGVKVSMADKQAITGPDGVAKLTQVPMAAKQVLKFTHAQFVTQSILIDTTTAPTSAITGYLKPVGETIEVANIENAQTINGSKLGATITFDQNAFVTADGKPASGAVKVQLTPFDITKEDLLAMPANGRARTINGEVVDLISAGLMTVDVIGADGKLLQLAPNMKATLKMNLPRTSIGGTPMMVGTTIPMWYFSENEGLWIEEGQGEVVASATSSTGLAVSAEVSHFSSWNWDFKWDGGGSMVVSCRDDAGLVPCSVVATITLPDGSVITRSSYLAAEATTIFNMPLQASILWQASDALGRIASATSGVGGSLEIVLAAAKTSNLVACQLGDGTAVACDATLEVNTVANGVVSQQYKVPAEGAVIRTLYETNEPLKWSALSPYFSEPDDQTKLFRWSGNTTSAKSGNVTIPLTTKVTPEGSVWVKLWCADEFGGCYAKYQVSPSLPTQPPLVNGPGWSAESVGYGKYPVVEVPLNGSLIIVVDNNTIATAVKTVTAAVKTFTAAELSQEMAAKGHVDVTPTNWVSEPYRLAFRCNANEDCDVRWTDQEPGSCTDFNQCTTRFTVPANQSATLTLTKPRVSFVHDSFLFYRDALLIDREIGLCGDDCFVDMIPR